MNPLRKHLREHHRGVSPARSNADLAQQHAREHHRFYCDHHHGPIASPANTGTLIGPGTNDRRPIGWYTGENAQPRARKI